MAKQKAKIKTAKKNGKSFLEMISNSPAMNPALKAFADMAAGESPTPSSCASIATLNKDGSVHFTSPLQCKAHPVPYELAYKKLANAMQASKKFKGVTFSGHMALDSNDAAAATYALVNSGLVSSPILHSVVDSDDGDEYLVNSEPFNKPHKAQHQSDLYFKGFKDGVNSDKVYKASLVESPPGSDKWAVPFSYGPSGGTLQHGVKVEGVPHGEANAVYGDLVSSKLAKGYKHMLGSPKGHSEGTGAAAASGKGTGKPCGDSFISATDTCHVGEGDAMFKEGSTFKHESDPGGIYTVMGTNGDQVSVKGPDGHVQQWHKSYFQPGGVFTAPLFTPAPVSGEKADVKPLKFATTMPETKIVDTHDWPAQNTAAQWGAKKIAMMEKLFADGKFQEIANLDTTPKSQSPNKYQKGVHQAWQKLMSMAGDASADFIKSATTVLDAKKEAQAIAKKSGTSVTEAAAKVAEVKAINPLLEFNDSSKSDVVDITGWKKAGGQLGSNPGASYLDPAGNKWYVKFSKSNAHALNECLAAKLYEAAGAPVLDYRLAYLGANKFGTATPWVDVKGKLDPSTNMDKHAAQKDFAVHAWLANWDAVGASNDNMGWAVDKHGNIEMTTLDTGGGLYFRAQGAHKAFGEKANEWDTLRKPDIAHQAAVVFKDMTPTQLADSAEKVTGISDETISALVNKWGPPSINAKVSTAATLSARRDDIAKRVAALTGNIVLEPVKPAPAVSDAAVAKIPKPPEGLESSFPKKAALLYGTALQGDVAKVEAIPVHTPDGLRYKQKLVQAMKGEAPVAKPHVIVTVPLPGTGPFASPMGGSKNKYKAQNKIYAMEQAGDIEGIKAMKLAQPHNVAYQNAVLAALGHEPVGPWHAPGHATVKSSPTPATPATPDSPSGPAQIVLPEPPKITSQSNAFTQKKFDDLYAAAKTGDVAKVQSIKTSADAKNTYSQKHHAYKISLLTAMGVGEHVATGELATPIITDIKGGTKTVKAIKLTEADLPTMDQVGGDFISKNAANVAQNKQTILQLKQWALAGDLAAIKSTPTFPSHKVEQYKGLLIEKMSPPPPPVQPYKGSITALDQHAPVTKANQNSHVGEKFDYLLVVGNPGPIQHEYGEGKWMIQSTGNSDHSPGFGDFIAKNDAGYAKLNDTEKQGFSTLKGNFTAQNKSLSKGAPTETAIAVGKAIMKAGPIIPEGTNFLRYFTLGPAAFAELKNATGKAIQQTSVMETSAAKNWHWGGNIKMRLIAGPGVRGLYLGNVQSHAGERETVFPPNTRFVVNQAKMVSGQLNIDAFILPTVDHQF